MELTKLFTGDERAVSPVIGVILMVAITVILAAVIGTFVLGLGDNISEEPRAGASFSQSGTDVTVTFTNEGNLDPVEITIQGDCGALTGTTLTAIGESATGGCTSGDTVTVTGTSGSQTGVIASYEVD